MREPELRRRSRAQIAATNAAITASSGRKPKRWQAEDRECGRRPSRRRREERRPEEQVEPDRGAEELGEVGRDRDRLGLDPEADATPTGRTPSRQTSGRLRPVAIPSFADSVWISIAIRFEATITQTSV